MRGFTLIEMMVSVAIIGIGAGTAFLEVTRYRAQVADVRRGYHGLSCGEREVERLRAQPVAAVRALAGRAYAAEGCEAPVPAMRLVHRAEADLFVLEVEVKPKLGLPRVVSLPFVPMGGAR